MTEKRIRVNVQKLEHLSRCRLKVKIAETVINLSRLTIGGKEYSAIKKLGRGRFIMKPVEPAGETEEIPTTTQGNI